MRDNLGFGVMISMLSGRGDTAEILTEARGKRIDAIDFDGESTLTFGMADGTRFTMSDNGQSCCESRYMRTDDDLQKFVGSDFIGAEIKDAPDQEDPHGEAHEVQFLNIHTSRGTFTMSSHNEHNGYYGGFSIEACRLTSVERTGP